MKNCTDKEMDQGYSLCECGKGVHLHQAGFEVETHICAQCGREVADKKDFFMIRAAGK